MGLPTALLLAESGFDVFGYDIDKRKRELLRSGVLPFSEKGLQELFEMTFAQFQVVDELDPSDVFIITVPTPFTEDKKCDVSFVKKAVASITKVLDEDNLVVIESTVSPGVTEKVVKPLLDSSGKRFFLAFVSEKAIPGDTVSEMRQNVRIIGGIDAESAERAKRVYRSFVTSDILLTDCTTAELIKLMENTYRDVNIALANEFVKLGYDFKVNIWEAISLANRHPRVDIHRPGPGVGGHCISIDPWFLAMDRKGLIAKARKVNDAMPKFVFERLKSLLKGIKDPVITVFGVAYKGDVDDTRESPAVPFIRLCLKQGFTVKVFDPHVNQFDFDLVDCDVAVQGSDCIVVMTDHSEFSGVDPSGFDMRHRIVFDTRNVLDHDVWKKQGFDVYVLGCSPGKC